MAGRSRRAARQEDWSAGDGSDRGGERAGRLSQTADDLRNRLGMRGSAAGRGRSRADEEFWDDSSDRRSGSRARTAGAGSSGFRSGAARAAAAGGGRGARRAPDYTGAYGDGLPGGRTALRDPEDFWAEPDSITGQRPRTGTGERSGPRRGGNGGGGRRGGGGGRFDDGQPRSRGERFRNWLLYGSWWRHWTWKKALAVLGSGIAVFILLCIGGFFLLYSMTPIPSATTLSANWQSSTVDFSNGSQMGTFDDSINGQTVDRQLLTPNQIPTVMTQAMTAAEDRHFYTEGGVSMTGLLRSAYDDVFGNGNLQGGSTITMQYAKNYYDDVDTGRNFSTKFKEIFIAMKLGHEKSKSWVMTNYLNTVPFGSITYGVGAAAENYFDINLTQPGAKLTVSQAAMLAALPNSPGFFNPEPSAGAGYTALVARWHAVLANMVRDGNISQSVASAQTFPKITPPPAGNGETGYTGYLMNMVEQQLMAPAADGGYGLSQQQIDTGGYKITTTFSMAKVKALARSINEEKAQMRADGLPAHDYDRIGAVLENSRTGGIVAIYGGDGYLTNAKLCRAVDCYINNAESAQPVGSSMKPYVLSAAVNQGMSVFTSKLNGYSPIWIPLSSTNGTTTSTELELSPTTVPPGCSAQASNCFSSNGTNYFKFDETDENSGQPLAVNVAAAISSDPAFEDLAHRDGIQSVINMAALFGVGKNAFVAPCNASAASGTVADTIRQCNDLTGPGYKVGSSWYPGNGLDDNFSPDTKDKGGLAAGTPGSPAIALGENPLTPIEQASTFATLADDGVYHAPHVIAKLQQNDATVASPLPALTHQVLSKAAAADVDWALSFDNNSSGGTAEGSVSYRRGDVIGKTGTLGSGANASQAWFIGATPDQYALSVALFTNNPGTQNLDNLPYANGTPGSQGGGWPATIWNNFMTTEYSSQPTIPLFQQVNGAPFVPWIQVQAQQQAKPTCKPGQFQNCTCPTGAQYCAQPNPTPTCQQVFGRCLGSTPSPSPSCPFFSQSCSSGGPSPSPTVSCTPSFQQPCTQTAAKTTSKLITSGRSSPSRSPDASSALQLAEESVSAAGAVLLRLLL
jgi:membrane peptidoglycan carboxypeptidase